MAAWVAGTVFYCGFAVRGKVRTSGFAVMREPLEQIY